MDLRRRGFDAQPRRPGAPRMTGRIRVGVGGWTFEPWRGAFYPEGLAQKRELEYASRKLTVDRDQRHLLRLAEAGELPQVARRDAGRLRLRPEGPALRHQPPRAGGGRRVDRPLLRQRRAGARTTSSARSTGSSWRPRSSTPTTSPPSWRCCRKRDRRPGDPPRRRGAPRELRVPGLRRARPRARRRHRSSPATATSRRSPTSPRPSSTPASWAPRRRRAAGYAAADLDAWAARARDLGGGPGARATSPRVAEPAPEAAARDVFLYVISGAKERNPAAAMALIERLGA